MALSILYSSLKGTTDRPYDRTNQQSQSHGYQHSAQSALAREVQDWVLDMQTQAREM